MYKRDKNKPILFVLSIDTEEEWDWTGPFPQKNFSVENVAKLPAFQEMCNEIGIKPTYFVDYAVADNTTSAQTLKNIFDNNPCEVAAHLHPWCNPPFFGYSGEKESHVINLPIQQVEQKLERLIQKLSDAFEQVPRAFRTGRWGIDSKVLQLLSKHGLNLDSSVYPFFQNEFYSCQGAPNLPYWPHENNPLKAGKQRAVYELPVTAGFNHTNFELCETLYRLMSHPMLNWAHLIGVAWRFGLLRKTYLSPELFSVDEMLALSQTALKKGHPVLHMFMHSSSLIDNNNSLVGKNNAYQQISNAVMQVVEQLQQQTDIQFCTISEAAKILQQREQD